MATRWVNVESIGSDFESLSDPRHLRNRKHRLVDVVVIAVCGMVRGSDRPPAIHRWAENRRDRLEPFLALPNGIPSRDGIRRLPIAPKPEAFPKCFQERITDAIRAGDGGPDRRIAIDGKTCRRSHDASQQLGALPIVSAWASEEGIALGQVATAEKSDEITAIPELLKQIDLTDSLITIDAMGCQEEIARDIVDGGGDFVIGLEDNQPKLRAAVEDDVETDLERDLEDLKHRCHEPSESAHGRIDERSYFLTKIPSDFAFKKEWPWIKAIGYSLRVPQHADGSETDETRYYILIRYLIGKRFSEAVRGRWAIGSMHRVLDVNFREDDGRARERMLGNNLSGLRRFAVTLLKRHPIKGSLRGEMLRCTMNIAFLANVLTIQGV